MPVYEYYCEHCRGVFELLRPIREAASPQPCPVCDRDGQRIVSKDWGAFVFRDGMSRRIPDRGKFWHVFDERDAPMTSPNISSPDRKPRYIARDEPPEERSGEVLRKSPAKRRAQPTRRTGDRSVANDDT